MKQERVSNQSECISASEVGQYTYCAMAWYLQRCGYKPESKFLEQGKNVHQHLGETLHSIQREEQHVRKLAVAGSILLILAMLIFILGVLIF